MRTNRFNEFSSIIKNKDLLTRVGRKAIHFMCCFSAALCLLLIPNVCHASSFGHEAMEPHKTSNGLNEPPTSASNSHKKLVIVIDDLGNNMDGTSEIMAMPVKLTVAVMPFLPTTERDARLAHEKGFDVLVHLPMEPNKGKPEWLGPGAIMSSMDDKEIRQRVEQAIDNVPYAIGINNHMGSKITADPRIMSIILDVCQERGLFFLDSRTNYRTVVGKLCREKGMPDIGNEFFLDDQYTMSHISKQMNKIIAWMKDHESCIIIGHVGVPGTKTASVIRSSIDRMGPDVEYVTISEYVREQTGQNFLRRMLPPGIHDSRK